MFEDLNLRRAEEKDVSEIVHLYRADELGAKREDFSTPLPQSYMNAFHEINQDKNQFLLVLEYQNKVIGTCHLTLIPILSFGGSTGLIMENIHIDKNFQGQGFGTWMVQKAVDLGREKGCKVIQLTTNKERLRAKKFYEKLGFKASHEGMKIYF
jgi:ribosomal protein S18 acetylase RimI-like enzyme